MIVYLPTQGNWPILLISFHESQIPGELEQLTEQHFILLQDVNIDRVFFGVQGMVNISKN